MSTAGRRVVGASARLFVALELPEPARYTLARWAAAVTSAQSTLRPLAPEALHLTLCFLGWHGEAEIEPIAAACEVVGGRPASKLAVGEPLWLPSRRPRVLAVRLVDRAGLVDLQRSLSAELAAGGWYRPEKRTYLPHVSVARVARGAGGVAEMGSAPPEFKLLGTSVTLFRSWLAPTGARYEALRSVPLSRSG